MPDEIAKGIILKKKKILESYKEKKLWVVNEILKSPLLSYAFPVKNDYLRFEIIFFEVSLLSFYIMTLFISVLEVQVKY